MSLERLKAEMAELNMKAIKLGPEAMAIALFTERFESALDRLAWGEPPAGTPLGVLENLCVEIKNAGESVSASLSEIAEAIHEYRVSQTKRR